MPLYADQVLNNRYRIDALLGQGGMGAVYRAWDLELDVPVAIKENLNLSPEAQKQFAREAKLLARLSHPNLPRVTAHFFIPDQGQYLVMDFVEGEDLNSMLARQGRLPEPQALQWISQICDALAYLHSQSPPIIHRDIKPANIKIRPDGRAMLVDFGIAKVYDAHLATTIGAKAVTPGYSPPEQYGGSTDARSDIYALGATLYHLLTGQILPDSVLRAVGGTPPPAPRQVNQQISPMAEQAILKAIEVATERRFQNVDQLRAALTRPAPTPAQPQPPAPPPAQPRPPAPPPAPARPAAKRSSPLLWLVLLGGGLAVIAVAACAVFVLPGLLNSARPTPTPVAFLPTQPPPPPTLLPPTAPPPPPTLPPPPPGPGARIVFYSNRDGNSQVYVMNADGSGQTRLSNNQWDDDWPAGSPDGKRIAFDSNRDGQDWDIYVMNANGSGQTLLTKNTDHDGRPAWSPDSQRIAWVSDRDGNMDIYAMSADGSGQTRLTNNPSVERQPAWSPDGQWIAFESDRDGYAEIYIMNTDGSGQTRLTHYPTNGGWPTWSPDSRRIAFDSDRDANWEIYVMNADGSGQTRLTESPSFDGRPAWSPDGQYIAFVSDRDGNPEIYIMRSDGTGLTRLTNNPAEDWNPAWLP